MGMHDKNMESQLSLKSCYQYFSVLTVRDAVNFRVGQGLSVYNNDSSAGFIREAMQQVVNEESVLEFVLKWQEAKTEYAQER